MTHWKFHSRFLPSPTSRCYRFFIFQFHVHFVFFAGFACVLRLACSISLKISRPTFCVIFKPVCNTKLVYSVSLHVLVHHHCARVMFIYGLWCKAMLIFHNPRQDSHLDASTRPRTAHLDLVFVKIVISPESSLS